MPTRLRSMYGYFCGRRLDPENAVGKAGVPRFFQQTSWNALERLAVPMPSICTTMKPKLGQRLIPLPAAERLGHERALRPGVDRLDDRILLARVEIARPADDAPDVGLAVAALGDEHLERLPARSRSAPTMSAFFQLADELAVVGAAQLVHRRHIDAAVGVDQVLSIGRELNRVVAVAFGQRDQVRCRRN